MNGHFFGGRKVEDLVGPQPAVIRFEVVGPGVVELKALDAGHPGQNRNVLGGPAADMLEEAFIGIGNGLGIGVSDQVAEVIGGNQLGGADAQSRIIEGSIDIVSVVVAEGLLTNGVQEQFVDASGG